MCPISPSENVIRIQHRKGLSPINFRELWGFRELLYFLTKRDIQVRYRQTLLGGIWAVLQPFVTMIVFSFFFGRLAQMPSDGIPYPIFVYAGLLPWIYFANAIAFAGNSLVQNSNLVRKVYFPRLLVPFGTILSGLLDFLIAFGILGLMMLYYRIMPGWQILLVPLLMLTLVLCAVGIGLWLSALNVFYRDIRYAIPFVIQVWLFVSPIIYPASMVGAKGKYLLALNPVSGVIQAFRSCLLGKPELDLIALGISIIMTGIFLLSGLLYFQKAERLFADLI